MSANRFAALAYDDDDEEISILPPVQPEVAIHTPKTPPFPELPPSIQKPLAKVSIKNPKPRSSRTYSFYDIARPIQPNVYAIVDDTGPPHPDAPPSSPLYTVRGSDTPTTTLADRLRSTLQKEEEQQKIGRHEARTFEMSTVITGQRFRRVAPLNDFRVLEEPKSSSSK
jgi:hypothetical protein